MHIVCGEGIIILVVKHGVLWRYGLIFASGQDLGDQEQGARRQGGRRHIEEGAAEGVGTGGPRNGQNRSRRNHDGIACRLFQAP
ncbi:hypothetical protein D3C87_1267980 [compost metagenome]